MMATHSTSKHNDLASIYVTTGHTHASNAVIFMHFNGIHNTLFTTGSSKHANPHTASMFIDDHCVGSANTIRNWNVDNEGTLFFDNSDLSNNQSTIQGTRVENFPNTVSKNSESFCSF
ncbi:hypothetical protein ABVK25_012002 [Lepraria finkii]|uniref:Uncharacterized protein n=1 Tax=Lepraria finkii TaxID=1340010 RepID=A0ABR4AJA1_9LECA